MFKALREPLGAAGKKTHVVPAGSSDWRWRSNQEGHIASLEQGHFSKEMTSPHVRLKGPGGTGQQRGAVKVDERPGGEEGSGRSSGRRGNMA